MVKIYIKKKLQNSIFYYLNLKFLFVVGLFLIFRLVKIYGIVYRSVCAVCDVTLPLPTNQSKGRQLHTLRLFLSPPCCLFLRKKFFHFFAAPFAAFLFILAHFYALCTARLPPLAHFPLSRWLYILKT